MPVTSSSIPPSGRTRTNSSVDSGSTTHSRPRTLTKEPTVKLTDHLQKCSCSAVRYSPNLLGSRSGLPGSRNPPGTQPAGYPAPDAVGNHDASHLHKLPHTRRHCYT